MATLRQKFGRRLRQIRAQLPPDPRAALRKRLKEALAGERYELLIGLAQEQQKIVSMPAVYRRLKVARFIALCQMTIKALTGELGETEAAKYLKRERTGPRSLTPIPKYHEAA